MKASLKGKGGIKGLLLLHGEKLGMVAVAVCALLFLYSSFSLEGLPRDYTPENLESQIRQTRQTIDRFTIEDAPEKGIFQPLKDLSEITVQPEPYDLSGSWDQLPVSPTVLRTDPDLLPAERVTGSGGSGLLAFIDERIRQQRALDEIAEREAEERAREEEAARRERENDQGRRAGRGREEPDRRGGDPDLRPAGGSFRPEGVSLNGDERVDLAYWACVVAKVPIKQQLAIYHDAFDNARGSELSAFPTYLGFFVERAEVRSGQPLDFQPVSVYDGQGNRVDRAMSYNVIPKIVQDWAEDMPEVVDPRYPEPALTFPLPPLVGRDWGANATHPDIPLESETTDDFRDGDPTDGTEDMGEGATGDLFGQADATGRDGRPTAGRTRPGGGRRTPMRESYRGARLGADAYVGGEPRQSGGYRAGRSDRDRTALPPGVTDVLLRFFDFNVQPGKKYKYRVRLVLSDPNQDPDVRSQWLDPVVLERIEKQKAKNNGEPVVYRMTAWSKPSATIGIPFAGSVRLADAKAASDRVFNDEPSVDLLVESFDVDDTGRGMQASIEETFRRGSVVNLTEDAEILVNRNQDLQKVDSFKFRTGITVLDIQGGERVSRDIVRPASVLLMSPAGQLSTRRELADADEVERYREIYSGESRRGRGRRDGEERAPGGRNDWMRGGEF